MNKTCSEDKKPGVCPVFCLSFLFVLFEIFIQKIVIPWLDHGTQVMYSDVYVDSRKVLLCLYYGQFQEWNAVCWVYQ